MLAQNIFVQMTRKQILWTPMVLVQYVVKNLLFVTYENERNYCGVLYPDALALNPI